MERVAAWVAGPRLHVCVWGGVPLPLSFLSTDWGCLLCLQLLFSLPRHLGFPACAWVPLGWFLELLQNQAFYWWEGRGKSALSLEPGFPGWGEETCGASSLLPTLIPRPTWSM